MGTFARLKGTDHQLAVSSHRHTGTFARLKGTDHRLAVEHRHTGTFARLKGSVQGRPYVSDGSARLATGYQIVMTSYDGVRGNLPEKGNEWSGFFLRGEVCGCCTFPQFYFYNRIRDWRVLVHKRVCFEATAIDAGRCIVVEAK